MASGGTPAQVSRFVGQEGENFQCDGTLPTMLAKSSFNLKVIVTSGESNPEKLAKLGNKVLGVGYEATSDTISVDLSVHISVDGKKGDKVKLSKDRSTLINSKHTRILQISTYIHHLHELTHIHTI